MKPRGYLMIEHRLIEKMLVLVKKEIDNIEKNKTVNLFFIQSFIDFMQTYVDRTHHGKEQDILFNELKTKTMNTTDISMMDDLIEEHNISRRMASELMQLMANCIDDNQIKIDEIKEKLTFFMNFYPLHITKEDTLFFPKTEKYFSLNELNSMMESFYDFDSKMIHEKYNNIYKYLKENMEK